MSEGTHWLPGLLVLLTGVAGAVAYVLAARRKAEPTSSGSSDDLEARYQTVVGELKEHVANAHLLPPDAWAAEKARLEALAVSLLKARDGARHDALKAEARADRLRQAPSNQSTFKGALIGGATVGFFTLLGVLVTREATPRSEGMQSTGAQPPAMGTPEAPKEDERLSALLQAVEQHPDDVDAVSRVGLYLLRRQAFDEARPFISRATWMDPFHVRTRVARAVVTAIDGSVPQAQAQLEQLGQRYADGYDAHLFSGLLAMDQNDAPRAIAAFDRYFAVAPADEAPPMMRMAVEQLRRQLTAAPKP